MKRSRILASFFTLTLLTLPLSGLHAATQTLRTGTSIDAINSITLVDSFTSTPVTIGDLRATVFAITFSIQAFSDSISIPLRIGSISPTALVQYAPQITMKTQSRYADEESTDAKPLLLGRVVSDNATTSDRLFIPAGTTGEATLLVAYAAKPEYDREDRLVITGMPLYFGTSTAPLLLNPSEVAELHTNYVELAE